MTRQSLFWKPIHFYLFEKRFHVTKTQGLRWVDPFWDPFQQGLLLAKSRDRNQWCDTVSWHWVTAEHCRSWLRTTVTASMYICEYHIPEIHSFGNWTFYKGFLLDEDTLWQPTRMGRTFGDKKNGLVIADCLAKDRLKWFGNCVGYGNDNAGDDVFVTLSRWLIHLQQTVRTGLEQKVGKQTKAAVSADWFLSATHHITINIVECK